MKRFIAGATCPSCKESDSLYFESKDQSQVFCSRCEYQAQRATELPQVEPNKESQTGAASDLTIDTEQKITWH